MSPVIKVDSKMKLETSRGRGKPRTRRTKGHSDPLRLHTITANQEPENYQSRKRVKYPGRSCIRAKNSGV
jgi:hypothetical protein